MKVKQFLYIVNSVDFSSGLPASYTLCNYDDVAGGTYTEDWVCAGEIEFEVDIDKQVVIDRAVEAVEAQEKKERAKFEVKMSLLSEKKQNLLAITHQEN